MGAILIINAILVFCFRLRWLNATLCFSLFLSLYSYKNSVSAKSLL